MPEYLTLKGLEKFKKELNYLKTEKRKEIADQLKRAASFGDLTENAAYQEAKEAQAFLEGRIKELKNLIKEAVIISNKRKGSKSQIGSFVSVSSKEGKRKFQIIGPAEADPMNGKISSESPLGKALLNRKKGEVIELNLSGGRIKYKILEID